MRVPFAVVTAFALAGCLGAAPPPGPAPAQGPTTLPWSLADCTAAFTTLAVPPERLAPLLPPGFEPVAAGPFGAPLPAGAQAAIVLDAYRCASGTWGDRALSDLAYGSAYTPVRPPADRIEEGVRLYFVKWDFLVPNAAARATLGALGLPARSGDATIARDAVPGGAERVTVDLRLDGPGGVRTTAVVAAGFAQTEPLPFIEFSPLPQGGVAVWHALLAPIQGRAGSGIAELPPGWVRDVVGSDRASAEVSVASWALDPANVTVPR